MKKILLVFVALFLLFPVLPSKAATFSDVTLYEEEISWLVDRGVIKGYPDGTFKPGQAIKRLNAVQMILRDIGFTQEQIDNFEGEDPGFVDLAKGQYGYQEALIANSLGIINGKKNADGDLIFDIGGHMNRSQMAKVLTKAYTLEAGIDDELPTFKDTETLDPETALYIGIIADADISTGYGDGTFRPFEKTTRQHFAVFLKRTSDYLYEPLLDTRVYFLGDDKGDAAVIEFPDQSTVMIDAGLDAAELDAQLTDIGLTDIDTFIATELSAETLNGATRGIFEKYSIDQAVDASEENDNDNDYLNMLESLGVERLKAEQNKMLAGDEETAVLFAENINDGVMMLRLWNQEMNILFAGSATDEMYKEMFPAIPYDIVQVSRKVKITDAVLNRFDPTYAILPTNYPEEYYRHLDWNDVLLYSPQEQYISTVVSSGAYFFFYDSPLNRLDD
ncbi:S-layer homology domain-containing protein [Jeotgalibacillus malaysiensis]|uniref:S-layer homology domain-containing protein n=1 Tax=Jeotgalibacillus malaysiensis TaxID=1508404 RepID=UPI00384E0612